MSTALRAQCVAKHAQVMYAAGWCAGGADLEMCLSYKRACQRASISLREN